MTETFELKPISKQGIVSAIKKAEQYRLLNDPDAAESICLDILEIDPGNEKARIILILAITDQFGTAGAPSASSIRKHLPKLSSEYDRKYYAGLIAEREARAFLGRGPARVFAYQGYREAMELYDQAAELSEADSDDAILRWNSCARVIKRKNLKPRPTDDAELPLE